MKPKHKEFVAKYIKNNNATKSVKETFGISDDNYAGVKGHRLLSNDKIQNAIADAIPDELLKEKHLALLRKVNKRPDGGEEIDVVAVKAGLDMGYKIKGTYAPQEVKNYVTDITFSQEEKAKLLSLI